MGGEDFPREVGQALSLLYSASHQHPPTTHPHAPRTHAQMKAVDQRPPAASDGGDLPPFGNVVTPQNPIFAAEILQRSVISVPATSWRTVKEETGEDAAVRLLQKIPSAD